MDEFQLPTPYQTKVMLTDGTRAIPTFIPEIQEEYNLTIREALIEKGMVPFNLSSE